MRDWLYLPEWWLVYGVVDPSWESRVIYVGITKSTPERRLAQHIADPSSAVYEYAKECAARGGVLETITFAEVRGEEAAKHLERALIIALPQILNRTHERQGIAFWEPHAHRVVQCREGYEFGYSK